MKRLVKVITLVAVVASMTGCAGNRHAVLKAGESSRQDVFKEVSDATVISNQAVLKIEFPVKNFKARIIDTYIKHSDPPYTVTINIDGQSVVLADEPVLENLRVDFMKNPEAGTGWKYNFKKELLLEPGKHHVTIAVPLSDVIIAKDLTLKAGANLLQLTPVYSASATRYQQYPRFNHGLDRVSVTLNHHDL